MIHRGQVHGGGPGGPGPPGEDQRPPNRIRKGTAVLNPVMESANEA